MILENFQIIKNPYGTILETASLNFLTSLNSDRIPVKPGDQTRNLLTISLSLYTNAKVVCLGADRFKTQRRDQRLATTLASKHHIFGMK